MPPQWASRTGPPASTPSAGLYPGSTTMADYEIEDQLHRHQPTRPATATAPTSPASPPAAATTSRNDSTGIAPNANLYDVKVLDANGIGQLSDVLAAIDWVIYHAKEYNIRVMNLSLAADSTETWQTDPLARAARSAVAAGITVVVAAGNFGQTASGAERFGTISSPGHDPSVITVGSANTKGTAVAQRRHDQPVQLARSDPRLVHRRRRRAPRRQPAQARPRRAGQQDRRRAGHRQGRRRRLVELPGQDLRRAVQPVRRLRARTARSR